MTTLLHFNMQDGDWVKGKTINDELFHGYIESIHPVEGTVKVRIIQSDNQLNIGKVSDSTVDRIQPLYTEPLDHEGQILNCIDLALSSRDKKWFMELTHILKRIQTEKNNKSAS
ncbi:IDEAL domain-containing protein [Melghirimyces algeriensis]|uniref:IDEAL domain-containing protein n=1 Tax=Melghirimyces algeriensis TaxID=910412 RepID=A0A521E1K9_9BACL|nr:IDEAL domain-containing protein [Melghirimyces algeriensis]SMO77000.1 IDEAL domain-containing protein [Melghirimyces algeriensis]